MVAGRTVLVRMESALTAANACEFTQRLQAFCVYGSRCVLDLRHCEQVDGDGISALLKIQEELTRSGGELRLVADGDCGIGRTLLALDRNRLLALQSHLSLA
jgi:anti-anti-sigma regulatory factor